MIESILTTRTPPDCSQTWGCWSLPKTSGSPMSNSLSPAFTATNSPMPKSKCLDSPTRNWELNSCGAGNFHRGWMKRCYGIIRTGQIRTSSPVRFTPATWWRNCWTIPVRKDGRHSRHSSPRRSTPRPKAPLLSSMPVWRTFKTQVQYSNTGLLRFPKRRWQGSRNSPPCRQPPELACTRPDNISDQLN